MFLFSRVAGKVTGIFIVSRWQNLTAHVRQYLGLGMIVQAGVAIGLVELINNADKELGNIVTPLILSTVIIYETVGPPLIKYILYKAGEAKLEE